MSSQQHTHNSTQQLLLATSYHSTYEDRLRVFIRASSEEEQTLTLFGTLFLSWPAVMLSAVPLAPEIQCADSCRALTFPVSNVEDAVAIGRQSLLDKDVRTA